jgi:hypothetical protein
MPLDGGASGGGATIPMPQRPSDLCIGAVQKLVAEVYSAGIAPLYPRALAALAMAARSSFARALAPLADAETSREEMPSALPETALQLLFDLKYLDAVLPEQAAGATGGAQPTTRTGAASFATLITSLAQLSRQTDPIAHTLIDKPLTLAVAQSVASLGTLTAPLVACRARDAREPHVAAGVRPAATPAVAATDGGDRCIFKLPAPSARFSHLPIQTPPLRSKHPLRPAVSSIPAIGPGPAGASSAAAASSHPDSSAGPSAVSDLVRQGVSQGLGGLARVGGVLSSTGLGGRVLGGLGHGLETLRGGHTSGTS